MTHIYIVAFFLTFVFTFSLNVVNAQTCPIPIGSAITAPDTNAVYYVSEGCLKRPILNPNVFFSHFDSWKDVQSIDRSVLNKIPEHKLLFLPYGTKKNFNWGSLIKTVDDPNVYWISSLGNKHPIASEDVFNALGLNWSWIEDVIPDVVQVYTTSTMIFSTDSIPPSFVYKSITSPNVYEYLSRSEEGRPLARKFLNMKELSDFGYRLDRIPASNFFMPDFTYMEKNEEHDERRITDLKQLHTALELYYFDQDTPHYPIGRFMLGVNNATCLSLSKGFVNHAECSPENAVMTSVPSDPVPTKAYVYESSSDGYTYTVTFWLDYSTNKLEPGVNYLSPVGLSPARPHNGSAGGR